MPANEYIGTVPEAQLKSIILLLQHNFHTNKLLNNYLLSKLQKQTKPKLFIVYRYHVITHISSSSFG